MEEKSIKITFKNDLKEQVVLKGMFAKFVNTYSKPSILVFYFDNDKQQTIHRMVVFYTVQETYIEDNILYLNKKDVSKTRLDKNKSNDLKELSKVIRDDLIFSEQNAKNKKRLLENKEKLSKYKNVETKEMKLSDIIAFVNNNNIDKVHVKEVPHSFGIYNVLVMKQLNIDNLDFVGTRIHNMKDKGSWILTNDNSKNLRKMIELNFNHSDYDLHKLLRDYENKKIEFEFKIINGYLAISYTIKFRKDFKSLIDLGFASILTEYYQPNEYEITKK